MRASTDDSCVATELVANPDCVEKVLREGAERARAVAAKTMARARKACGLR